MNSEIGFGRRVLEVLEDYDISFEHLPSGIDTMGVLLNTSSLEGKREKIIAAITRRVAPDSITIEDGIALVAVVGRGMVKSKGCAAKALRAVAKADINIRMIDQGSSEINIIIGVEDGDFEKAIRAIYNEFMGEAK